MSMQGPCSDEGPKTHTHWLTDKIWSWRRCDIIHEGLNCVFIGLHEDNVIWIEKCTE